MHPFKLPDFYMPYPARLNPHLEGARAHSKAWALRMGMIGAENEKDGPMWSEKLFDRMDFAFFTAQTHPDASAAELELLSDWYVWGWFIDDYCGRVFEDGQTLATAREYLARIFEFLPEDLETPRPTPENPVERGLDDLWPRTAPSMSPAWRRRYAKNMRTLADAYLREITGNSQSKARMLDPIEYVGLRREVSGMSWSATLVEHSLGAEIPAQLFSTRPLRVVNDTFADVVALRNDIISYPNDIRDKKINNAVLVLQDFFGCDVQRAVDIVNDLVTSRLYQLENTVATELEPLFDERGIDPIARQQTLTYVKAVQDWMAGDLEWETRPGGRYIPAPSAGSPPPSLSKRFGAAAGRIGLSPAAAGLRLRSYSFVPYQAVPQFEIPEVYMPFATTVSPHLDAVRAGLKSWARRTGMFSPIPGDSVWDEQAFDAADLALCCSLVYSEKSIPEIEHSAAWFAWMTHFDDYIVLMFGHTRNPAGAKALAARLLEFMPIEPVIPSPLPMNFVERGLIDLWSRTAPSLSVPQREVLRSALERWLDCHVQEIADRATRRVSDPIDYMEMRKLTFGMDVALRMAVMSPDFALPPELRGNRSVHEMEMCACDAMCLYNDIISYEKEIEFEGEPHNAVLVVQHFLDCDFAEALLWVERLIAARIGRFEHIVAVELPILLGDPALDAQVAERLNRWVKQLERWMSGFFTYQQKSGRYQRAEARRVSPLYRCTSADPKGLGTSAVRPFSPRITKSNESTGLSAPVPAPAPSVPALWPALLSALRGGVSNSTGASIATPNHSSELPEVPSINGLGTSAAQLFAQFGEKGITQ